MRIKLYLALLFIFGTVLVYQSTSFTSAEITNETALFISPEETALIAITYGEGRLFTVTNNSEKPISMENDGNIIIEGNFYSDIQPGSTEFYSIASEPEEVIGGSVQLRANWEGGQAELKSDIPQSNIDLILLELTELETEVVPADSDELIGSEDKDEDKAVETVEEVINNETNVTELNAKESPAEQKEETESTDTEEVETAADNESGE